jgi:hypothetical protein
MTDFSEVAYLREKVRALSAGLRSRLNEYFEELPDGQVGNLVEVVLLFLVQIEEEVNETSDPRELRLHCTLIDYLSQILEWLDHAHTAQTPRAHVSVLREISKKLLDGAEILVTPTIESNYRIHDKISWLETLAVQGLSESRQEKVLAKLPNALFRVWFPRVERENILNHALLGHEMGHPIADEFFEDYEQGSEYQTRLKRAQEEVAKDKTIAAMFAACEDDTERSQFKSEISERLADIHERALVEVVSDAVATFVFGPSALLSLLDFFIREALDALPSDDEYYPPNRYRWRSVLKLFKQEGYLQALREVIRRDPEGIYKALNSALDFLEDATSKNTDLEVIRSDPYTRVAYAWLDETLRQAVPFARKRSMELLYNRELIGREVSALVERLQANVPPSEMGVWPDVTPVDWRSALCASWVVALSHSLDPAQAEPDRRKSIQKVHNLALKAIDYIFLKRELSDFRALPK